MDVRPGGRRALEAVRPVAERRPRVRRSPWAALLLRFDAAERRRRLWHMLPGLLPVVLWVVPHEDPLSPILRGILLAIVAGIAVSILRAFRGIGRAGETTTRQQSATAGYALSVLLVLFAFPGHAELGMAVLGILAFGDGFATVGGLLLRGPRLPWNPRKSWAGTASFLVCGGLWAAVLYWGESQPGVPFATALACTLPAALGAALAESLPARLDDNIRVGLAASLILVVAQTLGPGWG